MSSATARNDRRRRRDDVREQLMSAIVELAGDASFSELTIDEIARRAGLSRSAFYFYFRDKHDLLMAAASEAIEDLYGEADRWWHGEGEPEALVREALGGVAALYARNARLVCLTLEVAAYDAEVSAFWRSLVERFVEATAAHLRRERFAGRTGPIDTRGTAEALVWMAERCLWLYLAAGDRRVEDVVDQLTPVWLAAIYSQGPALLEAGN